MYQPARTLYIGLNRTGMFTAAALHAATREVDARVPIADIAILTELRLRGDREWKVLTRA